MRLIDIKNTEIVIQFEWFEMPRLSMMGEIVKDVAYGERGSVALPNGKGDEIGMYASLFTAFCDVAGMVADPDSATYASLNEYRAVQLESNDPERAKRLYPVEVATIETERTEWEARTQPHPTDQPNSEAKFKPGDKAVYREASGVLFDCTIIELRPDNHAYIRLQVGMVGGEAFNPLFVPCTVKLSELLPASSVDDGTAGDCF